MLNERQGMFSTSVTLLLSRRLSCRFASNGNKRGIGDIPARPSTWRFRGGKVNSGRPSRRTTGHVFASVVASFFSTVPDDAGSGAEGSGGRRQFLPLSLNHRKNANVASPTATYQVSVSVKRARVFLFESLNKRAERSDANIVGVNSQRCRVIS